MIKFVVVLSKRKDMTRADFSSYLRTTHRDLAWKLPGLKQYAQNHVANDPKRQPPAWDAVVELYWESREAMEAAWASPEGERATKDLEAFADLSRTSWSLVEEFREEEFL
ncbi:MAG: EthD family reductase [Candidatus Acidiferrales bacterium]